MKKILLLCISVAFSAAGNSQNVSPVYSLSDITSSDDLEHQIYTYNSNMLLEATDILSEDGNMLKDSLTYDTSRNIIKFDKYQLINGNWTHVYYLDYTYDENGNCLSRSNYNSYGGPTFNLGGVYNYSYDDNKVISWELYMSGTDLAEAGTLTYNDDGQLIKEIGQDIWNSGSMEDSWKMDYQYNSDGTIKTRAQSFWNGNSWDSAGSEWFYYDDNTNCIKRERKTGNRVTTRYEYEHNMEYTTDQLVLPVNPEDGSDTESLAQKNNMVTIQKWYTENDAGVLVYVCDYIYTYDLIDSMGVPNHGFAADNMLIYPNPTSDLITITNNQTIITNIDVMDNTGRVVLRAANINRNETNLDVSNLNSGVYYVRLFTSNGPVTQKLIVQ